jgi:hypothetical protein
MIIPFLNHGNTLIDLSEHPVAASIKHSRGLPNSNDMLSSGGTYYESIPGGIIEIYPKYKGTVVPFPGEFIPKELAGGHHVLSMGNRILINEKY